MLEIKHIVSTLRTKIKKRHLIFLSAICFIFLIVVFAYFFVRNTLVRQAISTSTNTLSFIMKFQDSILIQADKTLGNLSSYPGLAECPEAFRKGKQREYYRMYQYLERVAQENEVYDHIAVYYPQNEKVLATRWGVSLTKDYNKEIMSLYAGNENKQTSFLLVDPAHNASFSLVKNIPNGYLGGPKAIVSISISSDYFKTLHQNIDYYGGNYFLTNQSNQPIYSSVPILEGEVWDTLATLQADPEFISTGLCYDIIEINGKSQLFTIVKSLNYDLIYCHYVPLQYITADVDYLLSIIIVFLIVVALLSACGTLLPVRSIYRAFANISDTIFSSSDNEYPSTRSPEEITKKITRMYEDNMDLLSLNSSMEVSVNKYMIYQKNQYLFDFLQEVTSVQTLENELPQYNISFLLMGLFCTVLFSMDEEESYFKDSSVEERNLYIALLINNATLEFSVKFPYYQCVQVGDTEVCFILNADPAQFTPELMLEQVLLSSQLVHETLSEESGISLSVSISAVNTMVETVPVCYKQSLQVRDGRWLIGFGSVMAYDAVGDFPKLLSYPYDVESKLLDALKANQEQVAMEYLDNFNNIIMDSSCLGIRFSQHCLLRLLSSTYRCLYEYYPASLSALPNERELYIDLLNEVTAQRMYSKICDIHRKIFSVLREQVFSGRTHTVQLIKAYIDKHYMFDITLEEIGEEFHLSVSHLRRIFKEKTEMSIKEYMDRVRMEQAAKLLITTNKSVSEIALSSGYVSQQTFIRIFKKTFNITPGEYRK